MEATQRTAKKGTKSKPPPSKGRRTGHPNFKGRATRPEQLQIVADLDELQAKVDSVKRLQSETAAELDALMPSILSKAIRGEP